MRAPNTPDPAGRDTSFSHGHPPQCWVQSYKGVPQFFLKSIEPADAALGCPPPPSGEWKRVREDGTMRQWMGSQAR